MLEKGRWAAERARLEKAASGAELRRGQHEAKLEKEKDRVRRRDNTISSLRCKVALAEAAARQPGDVPASTFARTQARHQSELRELEKQLEDAAADRVHYMKQHRSVSDALASKRGEIEDLERLVRQQSNNAKMAERQHTAALNKVMREKKTVEEEKKRETDMKNMWRTELFQDLDKIKKLERTLSQKEENLRQRNTENEHLKARLATHHTLVQWSRQASIALQASLEGTNRDDRLNTSGYLLPVVTSSAHWQVAVLPSPTRHGTLWSRPRCHRYLSDCTLRLGSTAPGLTNSLQALRQPVWLAASSGSARTVLVTCDPRESLKG